MSIIYVVQPGDTLSKILKKSGGSWQSSDWQDRIKSLNPHIEDPNRIDVNHLILIPDSPNEIVFQDQIDYVSTVQNTTRDNLLKREIKRFSRESKEAVRKQKFLAKVDRISGLEKCGIVCHDAFGSTIVIREPMSSPKKTLVIYQSPFTDPEDPVDDKLAYEVTGTILSCGAALIGVFGIFSGTALIPFTGGASTALIYLAHISTAASGLQCLNGAARTLAIFNGSAQFVDWVDSQEWYVYTSLFIDGLSLAGVAGAAATSIKTIVAVKKAASGKSVMDVLSGLSRQERKRLAGEIAKMQHPGIRNKAMKAMVRSGSIPKRYTQVQLTQELKSQVLTLFSSSASVLGSGINGIINSTGSKVSILLVQEVITE